MGHPGPGYLGRETIFTHHLTLNPPASHLCRQRSFTPPAKLHQWQSQRCLGSIHGTGPSCPAKQHGSPTHVLGWRGWLGRAPWRVGETPAAQRLCCMTSPRTPDNRQLRKTSDTSCPAPSLQVQSCKPSLAAAYDSHSIQVSPQMQLMQMLFAMRGQHVVWATSYWSKSKAILSSFVCTPPKSHSIRRKIHQTKAANMKPSCNGHKTRPFYFPGKTKPPCVVLALQM